MSYRCGDTGFSTIIERNNAAIAQWQLYFSLTLLTGDFSCYRTVDFIGKPIFTGYRFELQYLLDILVNIGRIICYIFIFLFDGLIAHNGTRSFTEHILHIEIDRTNAVFLLEHKTMVIGSLADNIHRCAFALGDTAHMLDIFLGNKHTHALLTLVTDNFFRR